MAIIKVTNDDVEKFTVVTTPRRTYSSSSLGVTGSVHVFPRASNSQKDTTISSVFVDADHASDVNFSTSYDHLVAEANTKRNYGEQITGSVENYFQLVSSASISRKQVLDVERFTPTSKLTVYSISKNNIKDMLMPYYRTAYPHSHWAYTNYNSLNFFAASNGTYTLPTSSVLLYPNSYDPDVPHVAGYPSGSYCLTGPFSFNFHINPRYSVDDIDAGQFKAGTLFHLSSSYALSIISGSQKDLMGLPSGFRLQLQLSHSADVPPSLASNGAYPNDLTFVSNDNCLTKNMWHHVAVRWGTSAINDGTGSFIVNGVNAGNFCVPSGTISPVISANNPDVLCVGNYYEGSNSAFSTQDLFFASDLSNYDGVDQLTLLPAVSYEGPASFDFRHPLKAEVHDLSIRRYYISDREIAASSSMGAGAAAFDPKKFAFYVPPFFVEETPIRRTSTMGTGDPALAGDRGGVLQTPFFAIDGTTDDPFNVAMSFGVAGHYINLENFVKDFTTGRFPRLLSLSASLVTTTTIAQDANSFLYSDPGVAKRNLTILPCDDGNFDPSYEPLLHENLINKFSGDGDSFNISYINLDNLVSTASLENSGMYSGDPDTSTHDSFTSELIGSSPEQPGVGPGSAVSNYVKNIQNESYKLHQLGQDASFDRGVQKGAPLTIFQRLQDPSSNQVTIFNISNLYYGRRIQPGTFQIRDANISGSLGAVSMTLKDDGIGGLYRADSDTPAAFHNSVGNIFYDEGVVVVKSPHLYFFGKNEYEISFKGIYNIYTSKYEILAPPGLLNSSSNPTHARYDGQLLPSERLKDNEDFVYIGGMNFHDENMNVIARAKLAQPVIKREGDKVLIKVCFDF